MTVEGTKTANTRVLKNGAIYDMDKKRIVALRPELAVQNTQITSESASQLHAMRRARKQDRIMAGANRISAEGGQYDGDDLDFVEAIAEVQMMKAMNPDDPKSTDAARFILQEAGLSDKQAQADNTGDVLSGLADVVRSLAEFARALPAPADVIDADVQDG